MNSRGAAHSLIVFVLPKHRIGPLALDMLRPRPTSHLQGNFEHGRTPSTLLIPSTLLMMQDLLHRIHKNMHTMTGSWQVTQHACMTRFRVERWANASCSHVQIHGSMAWAPTRPPNYRSLLGVAAAMLAKSSLCRRAGAILVFAGCHLNVAPVLSLAGVTCSCTINRLDPSLRAWA
jgi:hypothetical protein